ncbi:mechanosensitive ion channel family protein [Rubrolithibacter danxiaensis]|uniref:mechanosensitive ion channel family protein n=1 Tax=Rubrolithibacter danxiaensis TaxID=3390805 RepID=UPI003BF7E2F6
MDNLQSFFNDLYTQYLNKIPDLIWNTVLILLAVFCGVISVTIIRRLVCFYTKFNSYFLFKSIVKNLEKPARFFLPLLFLNTAMPLFRLSVKSLRFLDKVVEIGLTVSFAALLMGLVKIVEDYVTYKYDLSKADNLKERKIRTQLQFIRKLVHVVIVLVTIAVILLSFENLRKLGAGLLTGVGIGGIIVGFAAQRSLGNLLAGFQIAFTQPIRIDDALIVEGEFGRVEEITLTYVVVRLWDERRLILPINYFIEKPFQNWTRVSSQILGTVMLYLDYSVPVDELRTELNRLLDSNKLWDRRVGVLQVTDSKEKTLEIRVLVSGRNSGEVFDLRCFVRENLIRYINNKFPNSLPRNRTELLPTSEKI